MNFSLWLEFEHVTVADDWDSTDDFCNIHVDLPDGRHYGLTVWTYKFIRQAVAADKHNGDNGGGQYLIPPDLLVEDLTRECIELAIADLLGRGDLEKVLNPAVLAK
ncbi:hypothetical protein [Hymenobacter cheonanensis]|uniref:hypothetical protein n=1 Tax=Hymenobacter sp. CA2-7 TaxID=3063993 RepID=UPI0027122B0E|nr:hypothetical protein [Hymenobacter sp. CA2-7]MDO7886238.1 hypothetical protein [Hymenobacter sp. CA2-7]